MLSVLSGLSVVLETAPETGRDDDDDVKHALYLVCPHIRTDMGDLT